MEVIVNEYECKLLVCEVAIDSSLALADHACAVLALPELKLEIGLTVREVVALQGIAIGVCPTWVSQALIAVEPGLLGLGTIEGKVVCIARCKSQGNYCPIARTVSPSCDSVETYIKEADRGV